MQISRHTHTRYKPPVISEAIKPILFTNAANVQLNWGEYIFSCWYKIKLIFDWLQTEVSK